MGILNYRIALCMQISNEVQNFLKKNISFGFLIFNYNNNTMLNMEESKTLPLTVKGLTITPNNGSIEDGLIGMTSL